MRFSVPSVLHLRPRLRWIAIRAVAASLSLKRNTVPTATRRRAPDSGVAFRPTAKARWVMRKERIRGAIRFTVTAAACEPTLPSESVALSTALKVPLRL